MKIKSGNGKAKSPYICELVVKNQSANDWSGVIHIQLTGQHNEARFFLPGYMYGTNQGEAPHKPGLIKQFQRLRKGPVETPYSPFWFMGSDQLTHPVAAMFAGDKIMAVSGIPFQKLNNQVVMNGFSCSITDKASVGFTIGHLNAPAIYVRPWEYNLYDGTDEQVVTVEAGRQIIIGFELYCYDAPNELAVNELIKNVYTRYHKPPRKDNTLQKAVAEISSAIFNDAFGKDAITYALRYKKTPVILNSQRPGTEAPEYGENVDNEYTRHYEGLISWTNGTVIAIPLLLASQRLNKPEFREQAHLVINDIVLNSINPANQIPYCNKQGNTFTNNGWWTRFVRSEGIESTHSSYIVGQALYYILQAYDIENSSFQTSQNEWLRFVENTFERIKGTQDGNGIFPRFWDETDGKSSGHEAFSGCWVASAMAMYEKITNSGKYITLARKAAEGYFEHVARMECIETPLDVADSADSEGILAFIKMCRILHQITGDDKYLEYLKHGLDYEFTFKFCYNVPIQRFPLSETGFSTSGGSITSTCNAVIHCMSNNVLDDIYYYYRKSNDKYYLSRLTDTFYWGLQAYNRYPNEYFFGKAGWSPEYFCQTNRYILDIRLAGGERSNIWFAYHPWATASILEGMLGDLWSNNLFRK